MEHLREDIYNNKHLLKLIKRKYIHHIIKLNYIKISKSLMLFVRVPF